MKNVLKIFNLFLLTLLISIIGCNDKQDYKSETETEDSELVATLNAKYGVSSIVNDFDLGSTIANLKSSNEWNFAQTTKFDFEGSDQKVIIIPGLNDERFYAIKGSLSSNKFTIEKKVFCNISIDESGNGFFELLDEENNTIDYFTLIEGIPTSDKADTNPQNQLKSTQGWCQQEGGEGAGGCYKREVDEFCDGFLGCAVLATNPAVHVLIATMCAC